jgi:ferritin-like metal-binding protein YciE
MAMQLREMIDKHLRETKMLLRNKRNCHQIEEVVHRMGEKSVPSIHVTRD